MGAIGNKTFTLIQEVEMYVIFDKNDRNDGFVGEGASGDFEFPTIEEAQDFIDQCLVGEDCVPVYVDDGSYDTRRGLPEDFEIREV